MGEKKTEIRFFIYILNSLSSHAKSICRKFLVLGWQNENGKTLYSNVKCSIQYFNVLHTIRHSRSATNDKLMWIIYIYNFIIFWRAHSKYWQLTECVIQCLWTIFERAAMSDIFHSYEFKFWMYSTNQDFNIYSMVSLTFYTLIFYWEFHYFIFRDAL